MIKWRLKVSQIYQSCFHTFCCALAYNNFYGRFTRHKRFHTIWYGLFEGFYEACENLLGMLRWLRYLCKIVLMVSSRDLYRNSVLRYFIWFYWDFIWNVIFNALSGFKYRLHEVFVDGNLILNVNNELVWFLAALER